MEIAEDKLLRLPEVLRRIPISKSSWWKGVKDGRFPQSIKVGPRVTCWRERDIARIANEGA
ncbi:helix-turn-helix transcriptional regulator [Hyphomicrobium nitrativorans]|uniref:helix-turn-helix transcriptional regulator n=1 Tax=Hyphomicrobium nitrativorans TaxID=1427356 RepID=UPI000687A08D|nr:AlpA family phage regulatory protein [Hyphomicrobium nitrativorans]